MTDQNEIKTEPAVDTASSVEALASAIARKGYKAVGRYYSFSNWKKLQPVEAQQLIAAGLTLFTVYQDANNKPSTFTKAAGTQQAGEALHLAQNIIRQPKGSGIYFAVDYDASYYDYVHYITPYFEAIKASFKEAGSPYKIGIYGNGLVCENALKDGLVDFTWLSQSKGFRNYQEFKDSHKWNILQGGDVKISGTDFDSDILNMSLGDYGGFTHLETKDQTSSSCDGKD
ncbi:hypothetical protein PsAD2_02547 [Pseudovibrio axinellae]|uniref:Rv2525c-like glycoside hydrolase-like domain-containing protein n=1 Tax=Pseudovibrio axinellae TaxID=989403 RepID=A0A165YP18_9HYPH|nr:DUF1906 domain-containing protein [Pseudovibrio axinellae]KZL19028.1 hypothetical protein PsAD2_02547 [Pseudovibrio axinellae]SEP83251.1 protein of unknown function [Pseudovibrio axinellae]